MKHFDHVNLLLFDLDGTLVDSIGDITFALNQMRRRYHLKPLTVNAVKSVIGEGFPKTVYEVLKMDVEQARLDTIYPQAYQIAFDAYMEHIGVHTTVYNGVQNLLTCLKAKRCYQIVLVTNKEAELTHKLLSQLNLSHYFDAIIGGNSTSHYKPHPAPVIEAVKRVGNTIAGALLIGDSQTDMQTAHRAGMSAIAIEGGYAKSLEAWQYQPDYAIRDITQLTDLL